MSKAERTEQRNSEVKQFYHVKFTDFSGNHVQNIFFEKPFSSFTHHHCFKKEIQRGRTYEKFRGDSKLQVGVVLKLSPFQQVMDGIVINMKILIFDNNKSHKISLSS